MDGDGGFIFHMRITKYVTFIVEFNSWKKKNQNVNLGYIFLMVSDGTFILNMCILFDKILL